jgi:hypothetical protein
MIIPDPALLEDIRQALTVHYPELKVTLFMPNVV